MVRCGGRMRRPGLCALWRRKITSRDNVAAAVVATDARDCKGKFASGRMSELVDSDVVFRGFSSCEDSDGARFSQYFIVSRKKGGFVLFSVVSNMKTEEAKTVTKEERLVDFRKAALVVVN